MLKVGQGEGWEGMKRVGRVGGVGNAWGIVRASILGGSRHGRV